MRWECLECFPRHRLQRKPLVSDPDMHHGTCVTHVPWCMSGSLTRGGGENVPGIPGACATRNFTYQVRDSCPKWHIRYKYHYVTERTGTTYGPLSPWEVYNFQPVIQNSSFSCEIVLIWMRIQQWSLGQYDLNEWVYEHYKDGPLVCIQSWVYLTSFPPSKSNCPGMGSWMFHAM